jgi:hypothetical protein
MKGKRVSEPNWTGSKTGDCEIWKNPLIQVNDRLEIADGAIRFRDEQLDRLRAENAAQALLIASLKEERRKDSADMLLMIGDIRYVAGIAERGRGRPLGDGEKFTQAVLDYVKSLESQLSDTQRQNAKLMQRVEKAEKDAEQDRVWVCAAEIRLLEISGQLPGQNVMHQIESLRKRASEKKWEMLRRDSAIAASKVSNEGDENE